jgi:hypothetical protein
MFSPSPMAERNAAWLEAFHGVKTEDSPGAAAAPLPAFGGQRAPYRAEFGWHHEVFADKRSRPIVVGGERFFLPIHPSSLLTLNRYKEEHIMPLLAEYMIPITAFFLFRFCMGFREQAIARKRRLKTGKFAPTYPIYQGMGMWLGGLIGGLLCVFLNKLVYLFLVVTVLLMYFGRRKGREYGLQQDAVLRQTWEDIEQEEAENASALPEIAPEDDPAGETEENEENDHGEN